MEAVTQASLLEALQEALARHAGPDDALTTREWADLLGNTIQTTGRKIDRLIREEKMTLVYVRRADRRGVTQPVAAYRLKT